MRRDCFDPPPAADGNGIALGSSTGVDRLAGVGVVVAVLVAPGVGAPAGRSNRPRRCDAVGDDNAGEIGVEVGMIRGVTDGFGAEVVAGVAVGADDIVPEGAGVDVVDVLAPAGTGGLAVVSAADFVNFFGGAFGGGVASDFIFCRVFLASSWLAIAAQPLSTVAVAIVCFTVGGRSLATGAAITGAAMTTVSPRICGRDGSAEPVTFMFRSSRNRWIGSRLIARNSS